MARTADVTEPAHRRETPKIGGHAVVRGASMSGLLAARVLADAYQRVTIIERDPLPERGADRKGVPQGGLESYYWMFGQYDGAGLVEMPDSRTSAPS